MRHALRHASQRAREERDRWRQRIPRPVWRLMLAFLLVAVVTLLWRYTQSTPIPTMHIAPGAESDSVARASTIRLIEAYSGSEMVAGNRVEPLFDDALHRRLWTDLRSARRSITVQSYYNSGGVVFDSLVTILQDRVAAGVRVLILLDGFGSKDLSHRDWQLVRATGAEVAVFRPVTWSTLHHAANRSHVRAVVIDGQIGFTGGFGFADKWLTTGQGAESWRETNARIEGPAVQQLQAGFAKAWFESTGELLTGAAFFTSQDAAGESAASVLLSRPELGRTEAERFLMLLTAGTNSRLYITNSYFIPGPELRAALTRAHQRGVDVRILTAGPLTDVRSARYAGRYHYQELLDGGVRIYEYLPAMMHAKTIVADGELVAIGSMNLDNRSMGFNDEENLFVRDRITGATMDSIFLADAARSVEITAKAYRERSVTSRVLELGAVLMSRVL